MPELEANDLSAYGNSYASETDEDDSGSEHGSQMSHFDQDADEGVH